MIKKKTYAQVTSELKPFWETFIASEYPGVRFQAKMAWGHNFPTGNELSIKLYPSELQDPKGILIELIDKNKDRFHSDHRVLFYLEHDPEFETYNEKFCHDSYVNTDGETVMVYAVRINDLIEVNKTHVSYGIPVFAPKKTVKAFTSGSGSSKDTGLVLPKTETKTANISSITAELESEEDDSVEKEDDHYTKMTIRDIYCMMQQVPNSNKAWLNKLIKQGQQQKLWQK
jgi:hypothetical protein